MANNVLFLTLRIFSATGGIEKVCKVVCKGIGDWARETDLPDLLTVYSMYDDTAEADEKYIAAQHFKGFAQKKMLFAKAAVLKGVNSQVIVLSHINLLSIGYIIKLISPKTKLVIFAHGIEVWRQLSSFKKMMLRKCDIILSVSQFTRELLIKEHQLSAGKVIVLNNCLDPYLPEPLNDGKNQLLRKKYGVDSTDLVLMTLTRLSSKELYKGYDSVVMAVSKLRHKFPNLKYLIVGKYDELEKCRLDNLVNDTDVSDRVIFSGYVEDEDLAKYYSLADVYVMPSKKEGFGIVFIEAMYYGLPVIAGNKDGSADALLNGKLGLLVNPDDQDDITNAIESVIANAASLKPDRELLAKHFGYDGYKVRLKNVLKDLCD